ncbi:hypothetical protein [Roseimaritima sediminicola]|uniref:hypothetical protein n=1 Tax=Roseimaritima sediminicola TaxID=2662066 RepID=UPI0012983580|nr:hypothetical protein [Roseimaritima sediminicola]
MSSTTPTAAEARRAQQEAAETAARLQREIEDRQQAIKDAQQAERDAQAAEKAAEHAARIEERRKRLFRRVSHEVAQTTAQALIRLFKDGQSKRIDAEEFWQQLDDHRCRLHSQQVDESARGLVLSCEFFIGACDRWAMARGADKPGRPIGDMPAVDHRVEAAAMEIERELAGEEPPRMEDFYALFMANTSGIQMAKMLNLLDEFGNGDLQALAKFFSRMAKRAGVETRRPMAVRRLGALDLNDAWDLRTQRIEKGETDALMPGMPDLGQGGHPGRTAARAAG